MDMGIKTKSTLKILDEVMIELYKEENGPSFPHLGKLVISLENRGFTYICSNSESNMNSTTNQIEHSETYLIQDDLENNIRVIAFSDGTTTFKL